jgi:hypothetical protein
MSVSPTVDVINCEDTTSSTPLEDTTSSTPLEATTSLVIVEPPSPEKKDIPTG